MSSIEGLELMKSVFLSPKAQAGLVLLYSQSQTECTRNGVCGMEIGMAREKDQGAVLKLFLGDAINLDLDNTLTEDYVIKGEKISAKHSSGKIGTQVKAKWTSADVSAQEAIKQMIEEKEEYPHLLLTYFDMKEKIITIICITAEHVKNVIQELKVEAFTIPKGNSRGIEYSKKAMQGFLTKCYFVVEIRGADLKGGTNPIERRMNMLRSLGMTPDEIK